MSRTQAAALIVSLAFLLCPPAIAVEEAVSPRAHPKISVFANESKEILVLKGWPLIVRAAIEYPDPPPERRKRPIVLEAARDWTDIVRVEVRDEQGKICDWPIQKIAPAMLRSRIELGPGGGETVSFVVSPRDTKGLSTGLYRITAVIVGFKGPSESDATVRIMDHPESLSPQGEEARMRFTAMYRALTGEEAPRPMTSPRPLPQPPPQQPSASGGAVAAGILSAVGSVGYGDFADPYYGDWAEPEIPEDISDE